MKELDSIMTKIVEENVINFKEDLSVDIKILLTRKSNSYIWLVRKNGTNLLNEESIRFKNTQDNLTYRYMMNNNYGDKCYRIVVEKASKISGIFGTITKINSSKLYKEVMENLKEMDYKQTLKYANSILHNRYSFDTSSIKTYYSEGISTLTNDVNDYINILITILKNCEIFDKNLFDKMQKCKTIDMSLKLFDTYCSIYG